MPYLLTAGEIEGVIFLQMIPRQQFLLIGLFLLLCWAPVLVSGPVFADESTPSAVVASVDDRSISAAELEHAVQVTAERHLSHPVDREFVQEILDSLILERVMIIEADNTDSGRDYGFRLAFHSRLRQSALRRYYGARVLPDIHPTPNDVVQYWQDHPEQFLVKQVTVNPQHIAIREDLRDPGMREMPEEYKWKSAESIINDLYRRLMAGENFDTLARYYSQDHYTRANGGRIGWRTYDPTDVTPWLDSVFSFPVGQIMPPFPSHGGWFIVRINGRYEPGDTFNLDEATVRQIAEKLADERMNTWLEAFNDSILEASTLTIVDSLLYRPPDAIPRDLPVAFSNETDTIFGGQYRLRAQKLMHERDPIEDKVADRRELIQEMHRFLAQWRTLEEYGFLSKSMVDSARAAHWRETVKNRLRMSSKDVHYAPSKQDIDDYIVEHRATLYPDRPFHLQQIVLESLGTARQVVKRLRNGEDFAMLAQEYFRGDSSLLGMTYDLGWVSANDISSKVFAAAVELDVGQISDPIHTDWGYHVIRLVDQAPLPSERLLRNQARKALILQHRRDQHQQWRERILSRHTIEIHEDVVAAVAAEFGADPAE